MKIIKLELTQKELEFIQNSVAANLVNYSEIPEGIPELIELIVYKLHEFKDY